MATEPLIFKKLREEEPNDRQKLFFSSTKRKILYGGAKMGGKSWAMRRKFVMLAINFPRLKLLLLRRTLPELRENHIIPLRAELEGYARYNDDEKAFTFPNGSRIKLGYCDTDFDVTQYQGQEYDVIGFEEAGLMTEYMLTEISLSARNVRDDFVPRIYFTANPGGPGHAYLKRLFVDKAYKEGEDPNDYEFIPAKATDNVVIKKFNPQALKDLDALPEDRRRALRDGDWDVFAGQYFNEWRRDIHVLRLPFEIKPEWRRYFVHDYGLDMWAAYWIAMDFRGRAIVYRERYLSGIRVGQVVDEIRNAELPGERIYERIAPPDLFAKNDQTGRSPVELWGDAGLWFSRSKNDRVQGWYEMKEWLVPYEDEQSTPEKPLWTANLLVTEACPNLIRCIPLLQHATKGDPNDAADEPHEVTHANDAIRYFLTGRPSAVRPGVSYKQAYWEDDQWDDYERASDADKAMLIERWGNPFPQGA